MTDRLGRAIVYSAAWAAAGLACAHEALAIVIHPSESYASAPALTNVVGHYAGASAVAIAPNFALASRHQGGGNVGDSITFGGVPYKVADVQDLQTPTDTGPVEADLRVLRLTTPGGLPANLASYAPVHTGAVFLNEAVTIGGFGLERGATLTGAGSQPYAYAWGSAPAGVRFGKNTLDAASLVTGSGYTTTSLITDFDGPGALSSVAGEASVAAGDSGGGWFVQRSGTWYTVGISIGLSGTRESGAVDQSRFANPSGAPQPDLNFGAWVTQYEPQITAFVPEPASAALVLAPVATLLWRRRR